LFEAKRILFPMDAPALGKWFAPQVAAVANRLKASITLLHVRRQRRGDGPAADGVREVYETARWLETRTPAFELCERVAPGHPAHEIVEEADAGGHDLVMIPFERRRLHWLAGESCAEQVARDCRCAVWAAGTHTVPGAASGGIVCALDLGPESSGVLSTAASLADLLNGALSIVHTMPDLEESLLTLAALDELPPALSRQAAEREIAWLQRLTGTSASVHIEIGELPRAVRRVLRRARPSLMVIGAGDRAESTGMAGDNVAPLVRASSCPVLVLEKSWAFRRANRARKAARAFAPLRRPAGEAAAVVHKGPLVRVFGRLRNG
jgi:nucleotide-binding universal stress UspA family protein